VDFVKYVFFVYGSVILVQIIFKGTPLRYMKPFKCTACLSFWVGLAFCGMFFPITGWPDVTAYAIMASGASWFLDGLIKEEK
jgi:hypothetical protein